MQGVQKGRYAVVPKLKAFKDPPIFPRPALLAHYTDEQRLALVASMQRQAEIPSFRKFRQETFAATGFFGIRDANGVLKPQRVLEAGCGLAFDIIATISDPVLFDSIPSGTEIIAVDIDPTALHAAAERLRPLASTLRARGVNVRLEQADLGNPTHLFHLFQPASFDAVHFANTLVHMSPFDRRRAASVTACHPELKGPGLASLDSAAALVRPGGRIVTAEGDLRTSTLLAQSPRLVQLDRAVANAATRTRAWGAAGADAAVYLKEVLKFTRARLDAQGWITTASEADVGSLEALRFDPTVVGSLKPNEVDEYVESSIAEAKAGTHMRTTVTLLGVHVRPEGLEVPVPERVPLVEGAA